MPNVNSLPYISESVVEAGLVYGKEKFGLDLNRDLLIHLYDKTRSRRAHTRCSFREARVWALDSRLLQRDPEESRKYQAYSGAIGKMGSEQRKLSQKPSRTPHVRTDLERIKDHVMLGPDGQQFQFILSQGGSGMKIASKIPRSPRAVVLQKKRQELAAKRRDSDRARAELAQRERDYSDAWAAIEAETNWRSMRQRAIEANEHIVPLET